mgnify:CR=1 FL=1
MTKVPARLFQNVSCCTPPLIWIDQARPRLRHRPVHPGADGHRQPHGHECHFAVVFHDNIITASHVGAGISAGSSHGTAGAAGKGVGTVLHGDDLGRGIQNVAVRHLGLNNLHRAAGDRVL